MVLLLSLVPVTVLVTLLAECMLVVTLRTPDLGSPLLVISPLSNSWWVLSVPWLALHVGINCLLSY